MAISPLPNRATLHAVCDNGDAHLGQLIPLFPERLATSLSSLPATIAAKVMEIRINFRRPFMIRTIRGDFFLTSTGYSLAHDDAIIVQKSDLNALMDAFTSSSVYAVDDMMREGFLPLPGGHRVGLIGEVRTEDGRVLGFRHISGLNVRVSRPLVSVSYPILPRLIKPGGTVWSTLIIAPPGAGKTTLLRDIIRTLSDGSGPLGIKPHRVSVADERGELAGGCKGEHGIDLGQRTDVMELAPKAYALRLLLRSMGPDVIATDEIGHVDDSVAIMDAVRGGVTVVCTAHADTVEQLSHRPTMKSLWDQHVFQRIVVLSHRLGPGTVEQVVRWKGS